MSNIKENNKIEIITPKNQLNLFGYDIHFDFFKKVFQKKIIPKTFLLTGPKGTGKSTFAYHFINYLFSQKEEHKYNVNKFSINENNSSFKSINSNTHPNFFLIENTNLDKEIKIEQIRSLLKFLNKSTYYKNLKIVMIDNVENLNLNSSNALLKSIEEPPDNTIFFLIHNSEHKILDTILSRCTKFRFFFTQEEKKNIFLRLLNQYDNSIQINSYNEDFHFDTPGNIIKFFIELKKKNIEISSDTLSNILQFIKLYQNEKNVEVLTMISLFIEKYYHDLCIVNKNYIDTYFFNYRKILNQINDMKKFNLNDKNTFIIVKDILINEKK